MKAKQSFGQAAANPQRLGVAALFGCIIIPIIFIALVKHNSHQLTILSMQLSVRSYGLISTMDEEQQQRTGNSKETIELPHPSQENPKGDNSSPETEVTKLPLDPSVNEDENRSEAGTGITKQFPEMGANEVNETVIVNKETQGTFVLSEVTKQNHTIDSSNNESGTVNETAKLSPELDEKRLEDESVVVETESIKQPQEFKEKQDEYNYKQEVSVIQSEQPGPHQETEGNKVTQESKMVCDTTEPRSDTCSLIGSDIRVLTKSSTVAFLSSENSTMTTIRPYARKWEEPVMEQINEILITSSSSQQSPPPCSVRHSVPAVIFSTGGFLGNLFHDFTDVLVPLFATSRRFQGEVQFLVTDFNSKWISKYQPILQKLSRHQIINMDNEDQVYCFPEVHVGLLSHKVLGLDASETPNGYTMTDFKKFLRDCFSLNKASTNVIAKASKRKPRLLMILRRGSRSLINARQVVSMARSVGYKVITAAPEDTRDMAKFARVVNSCDVMMGVHGAGLTNMVFLPTNASLIQVVPWGGLKWACRHDFGEPAPDMGVNYVEYEIKEEESSLIREYPRDHAVFKDPMSIHKQGFNAVWSIFLDKQSVKLDVGRFRDVLLEIYQSLKH